MQLARYVRLYTDNRGETHFEDLKVPLTPQEFAPADVPLNMAKFLPVNSSFWLGAPGEWAGDVPRPASKRQIFCTVQGEYEITASDGDVRCFPAGSVLFFDDIHGKGHLTRITNNKGALVFAVSIAEERTGNNNI
jgi:uncharacterized cupin superfamily protein